MNPDILSDVARKVSVMQLVYSLQIGGSERLAVDISSHLDPDQFRPSVSALDFDGELAADLERQHIQYDVLNRRGVEFGVFERIYRLLKHHRVDVVHTHHFTQLLYGALPARAAGARIVHTEHEFYSYTNNRRARVLLRPLSRLCGGIAVVGPEVGDYLVQVLGVPRQQVSVIPNGVDIHAFEGDGRAVRQELGVASHEMLIGTVGRLELAKDHMTLIDVFRRVVDLHAHVRLMIVGAGSMAEQLASHAARVGVLDRTLFLGARHDVPRLLPAMDVFVLSSIEEGLPISLIEAMAARRPVVASDIGSVRSLVKDAESGFLVAPRNVDRFCEAVNRFVNSPELRRRLGEAGRSTVESSFDLSATVRAYEDLYRTALGQPDSMA